MKRSLFLFILFFVSCNFSTNAQINTNRVLAIGKNALYFEDYVLSIQYFNQVIRSKPYLAEPYLYRALAKLSLDDFKGAENDFTLCLERNPFLVHAYQYRGAARQSLGDFEGAIADYTKGLEFRPEDKQMLLNKSIAFVQLENYDSALSTVNLLLKYQPNFTQAYVTRGSVFAEQKDTVKAFTDFDKAIELDRYYVPAYAQRGMLYFHQADYTEALKDYDQAIYLETKHPGYHTNRGLIRFYLNDLRGAMADYDQVISLDFHNLIARFNRGLLRAQVGDVYGAIEDFNVAIELEPDNFMAIYNRALLNEEGRNYREAVADLDAVINEYPNFVPAFYFRSEIKRKLNDLKGADEDYWYAYDLEQNLRKQQEQGKVITGKDILDSADKDTNESKVREKSDKNIANFNRLVVYDKEEENRSRYNNEIRGRVQDRNIKIDLEPQFVITYYENLSAIDNSRLRIDKTISDYNNKRILYHQLKLVNQEVPLTDEQASFHFNSIDHYSLVLDRNSSDIDAYFGRALDYMILQDLSEAIDDFGRVIALDPNFILAYFNRAAVRHKQMEITEYSEENDIRGSYELDLIMRDYVAVIQLNPDFVYAYFNRGNIYNLQKDYRMALNDYNEAIKRNPDFAEAYFNRGLTRLHLGDTNRGVEDLSKAGELGLVNAYSIIKKMTVN
jgi:tetratricopeptide (TPR) repeat protein